MFKSLKIFMVLAIFVGLVTTAQAAVYGYINVTGRDQEQIAREVATIERLVKTWKNGEVLYTHMVTSGAVFFKKITATVFFAGEQSKISTFLSSGAYEGDYLKDIVLKFDYVSRNGKGEEYHSTFSKKFRNIRDAVNVIKGKDSKAMWLDFSQTHKREYAKHHVFSDGYVNVVFYSLLPVEENRLLGITFCGDQVKATRSK